MRRIVNVDKQEINQSFICGLGLTVTLFTYVVPSHEKLTVTHFGNYINLINTHWGQVTWSIRRNGIGVYPYENVMDEIGQSFDPRPIKRLKFTGGDLLEVIAWDAGVVAQPPVLTVGMAIKFELEEG